MTPTFLGIIPARYASTRFPGKPLAKLGSMPVIQHVYTQASKALDNLFVATDNRRIYDAVTDFGGKAIMTADTHRSGTDRCREAFEKCGVSADVIINIQGDEPFIQPAQIEQLKGCFDTLDADIATLAMPFFGDGAYADLANPNSPKVVMDDNGYALLFSRSVIPYLRGVEQALWPSKHRYFTHVGMYAYRTEVLNEITRLPQSSLEVAESLEQLRWLQNGFRIRVAVTNHRSIGIDTPDDLARACKFLETMQ